MLGHILASGSTNGRLTQAVPALMVVAITALLGSLLRSASTAATGALEPKVQRVATEQYLALVHRVELAAIEDDEFHRLLDAARYGADSARRTRHHDPEVTERGHRTWRRLHAARDL
ncbi:hypothetical protein AB0D45_09040 [Streptomyces sp. NPDC048352]|uniref:hypothetical protein n=1 Tax=Streptomyces sp. NPDC048352 TaxID=3154718 RepID=UPI00343127DF